MPVMDEFKNERAAVKNGTLKDKAKYFMDYYIWYVVGGLAIAGFLGWLIHDLVVRKDPAFYVAMTNISEVQDATLFKQELGEIFEIDPDKQEIVCDTTMEITADGNQTVVASIQKFVVYVASGDVDVYLSNDYGFDRYAYSEFFEDLRNIYTEEELGSLEGKIYYIDRDTIAEKKEFDSNMNNAGNGLTFETPDPFSPELMEDPIPIGIVVSEDGMISDYYKLYNSENGRIIAGVITSSERKDDARLFLDYILK